MRASTNKQELEIQHDLLSRAGFDELYQEHISGGRRDRPQFRAMVDRALELSSRGVRVYVLVVNDSRFARDVITSLSEIERLEAAGCKIRSIEGGAMSLATPEDFLLTVVKAATAQHYSLNLSREIKKSYEHKRRQKLPCCNKVPWPYRRGAGGHLEPDPTAWPIARAFVDRLIAGDSIADCLYWLAEQGLERSRAWVRIWTANPTIRGHLPYTIGGRTRAEKSLFKPTEIIYNTHPALITEIEYQAIAQGFTDRQGRRGKNRDATIYPVPAIVWCSCGRKANPAIDPSKVRRHRCQWLHCPHRRPSTRDDAIEAAIQETILEAAEAIAAAAMAQDTTDPRIAALEAEAAALGPLSHRAGVAAEIEAIGLEVAQLKAAQTNQAAGVAELRESIQALGLADWESLSQQERRAIYGAVVERVVVEGGEVMGVELVRGV